VAEATAVVCTRVPGDSGSGQRSMHAWTVKATMAAVTELGDHLRCQGIEVVTVESTSNYCRFWYVVLEAAGLKVQLVQRQGREERPGAAPRPARRTRYGWRS
jgi:transposase